MQYDTPEHTITGRKGRVNPEALRAALIAAGLLRPRLPDGLTRLRTPVARLEIDAVGRAVAAARVAGDLDYYDCADTFESWVETNFSRRLRMKGEP